MIQEGRYRKLAAGAVGVAVLILLFLGLGIFWSSEPEPFDVKHNALKYSRTDDARPVVGTTTTAALIELASVLLNKRGGFLSNDVAPPGVWLDNMPNWEFGVLVQVRDLTRAMRKDFSRSQSQSKEDTDLSRAEPQFNFDNSSWLFPASEAEYRTGIKALKSYLARLSSQEDEAQFYARADNLRNWLADIETRLGSLSQRLSASVTRRRLNTDLAGEETASQSTAAPAELQVKTPGSEIDDVFYEARGTGWALIHLLAAVEVDFADTLGKKNALVSLRQITRELEGTQLPMGSPIILNGSSYGLFANHSLVMASYIARAHAAIIDLRELLSQG